VHILGEEAEDGKEGGERATAADFVEQTITVHVFFVPLAGPAIILACIARLGEDLDGAVDNAIETFILVERDTVARNKAARL
jgi:hypothetical protein